MWTFSFQMGFDLRWVFLSGNPVNLLVMQERRWLRMSSCQKVIVVRFLPEQFLVANAIANRPHSLSPLCHWTSAQHTSMHLCFDCSRSVINFLVWPSMHPWRLSYTSIVDGLQLIADRQIQWLLCTLTICTNSPACGSMASFSARTGFWSPPNVRMLLLQERLSSSN